MTPASLGEALRGACDAVGIRYRDVPADGRWHVTDVECDRAGKGDGRIKLFPDGEGGIVCNWKGERRPFFAVDARRLTGAEREDVIRKRRETIRRNQEETATRHAAAASKAVEIWATATDAPADHAYLMKKGIKPHGTKVGGGSLVIPMRRGGEVRSLQFIRSNGEKRFLANGEVTGCYFGIGNPNGALCVCEGFATGASVHEGTGHGVAVAFNAGNLLPVARALRAKYPELELIICADNDWRTMGNPGMAKATEAARAVGAKLAVPDFGPERQDGDTDFNDLAIARGIEAVRECIAGAKVESAKANEGGAEGEPTGGDEWPEPQPLLTRTEAEPYPLDALPDKIRAAVEEVQAFVQAPLPLVASSALGALSVAAQAYADVKRDSGLVGPSGVYLNSIADSGERKTKCDAFFTDAIRSHDAECEAKARDELKAYGSAFAAWEIERKVAQESLKRSYTKRDGKAPALERELAELDQRQPEEPKVPRLMLADETPENLAYRLAKKWPVAGVISAEAGIVFGSHGMGKDSVMRNLALLNILWDGGELPIGRKTSESYVVRGARLSMTLQAQEAVLQSFFEDSGGLARGTGFLARFLICRPESTQGTRFYRDPPAGWPKLTAFNDAIAGLLSRPIPIDGESKLLAPAVLSLSPAAKQAWVKYHDDTEVKLRSGGELYDVRDVASKSAENAARLAALFHVLEHGASGSISVETFEGAAKVAAWYLNESRRFFGELALPTELVDAIRLERWLLEHCRRERAHMLRKSMAMQYGPLRKKDRLDRAINELAELDHVRTEKDGKRVILKINPALFANAKTANLANGRGSDETDVSKISKISVSKLSDSENRVGIPGGGKSARTEAANPGRETSTGSGAPPVPPVPPPVPPPLDLLGTLGNGRVF